MKVRTLAWASGLACVLGIAGIGPAQAASSCSLAAGEVTVKLAGNDTSTLSQIGGQVKLNAVNCGVAARVKVVETVPGIQDFAVKLPLGTGSSETKVAINLGANATGKDLLRVVGTPGADVIKLGTSGIDVANDGDLDILNAMPVESLVVDGGAGADVVNASGGGALGFAYNKGLDLRGGPGADSLTGGAFRDALHGSLGDDTLVGGAGRDFVTYLDASSAVQVNLEPVWGLATGGAGADKLHGIEDVVGSAFNDSLRGSSAANTLQGIGGPDTLVGLGGDDQLVGGTQNDSLNGGAGFDYAGYQNATGPVAANLTTSTSSGADGVDGIGTVEGLIGSPFGDTLTGSAVLNDLQGMGGDDALSGLDGPDVLRGGLGADSLAGGAGIDTVHYLFATGPVDVDLSTQTASGADGSDVLSNVENAGGSPFDDTLVGNGTANVLTGHAGADVLVGIGGPDTLQGAEGDDSLSGGSGADLLQGGTGSDFLSGGLDLDTCDAGVGPNPATVGCP